MRLECENGLRLAKVTKAIIYFVFTFCMIIALNFAVYNIGYNYGYVHGKGNSQKEIDKLTLELFFIRQNIEYIKTSDLFNLDEEEVCATPGQKQPRTKRTSKP